MRNSSIFIAIFICATSIFAQTDKKYVQPKESVVGVYANQIRQIHEEALFKVTLNDRLLVLEEKGNFYRVKSSENQIGWVEKSVCINLGKSKVFKFDNTDVIGYIDNPTPIYLIDVDDPRDQGIYLDRSFNEALRDNIDQENIKRQTAN